MLELVGASVDGVSDVPDDVDDDVAEDDVPDDDVPDDDVAADDVADDVDDDVAEDDVPFALELELELPDDPGEVVDPAVLLPEARVESAVSWPGKARPTYTVSTPTATAVPTPIQAVTDRRRRSTASRTSPGRPVRRAARSPASGLPATGAVGLVVSRRSRSTCSSTKRRYERSLTSG